MKNIILFICFFCINASFAQENNNCLFGFCLGSKPSEIKNISIVQNQDQSSEKVKYMYFGKDHESLLGIPIDYIMLEFTKNRLTNIHVNFKRKFTKEGIVQRDFDKIKTFGMITYGNDYTKRDVSKHPCTLDEAIWDVDKDVLLALFHNNCEEEISGQMTMYVVMYQCEIIN